MLKNIFVFILGATVFYPADAVSCERSIELAANTKGICFIRTSRPATAVIYKNDEVFEVIIVFIIYIFNIVNVCLVDTLYVDELILTMQLLFADWKS